MKPIELVVTRHAALIDLLIERGLTTSETLVLDHATIDDVRDKHVAGVLPFDLAAEAYAVTQIPLAMDPEDRGKELSIERLREIAGPDQTYIVRETIAGSVAALTTKSDNAIDYPSDYPRGAWRSK